MARDVIGVARRKKLGSARMQRLTLRAKELLSEAKAYRQKRETAWKQAEQLYVGKHWGDVNASQNDLITVNYAGSTVNTIIPFITAEQPQFRVDPYGGEATVAKAREQTAWLNRWWRSNDVNGTAQLRRSVFDYLTLGDGWLLPRYEMRTEQAEGSVFEDKTTATIVVERVDPWDVWIDRHSRWVIRRFISSVEELKQDPQYLNTKDLRSTSINEVQDPRGESQTHRSTAHERDQLVEVYEFYDRVTNELLAFTDQLDIPIKFVENIKFPLIQLGNVVIPGSPYHMGELEQIYSIQQELNKSRSQMVTHRRRNVAKYFARKDALTSEAKTALRSEIVNDVVEVDDRGQDLRDIILPVNLPQLSPDAYQSYQIAKQDMYDITGVSEYLRGGSPGGSRTATEASIIEGANNVKTAHKLSAVEDALQRLGQLIIEIATDVFPLTTENEVNMIITGQDAAGVAAAGAAGPEAQANPGLVETVDIDPAADEGAMWSGEYQVFVEKASTQLRDPFAREQKMRQLFIDVTQFLPVLQAQQINPDLRKLLELWMEAAGIEDFEAIFGAAGQPQQSPEELAAIAQGGGDAMGQMGGLPARNNVGPPIV